MDPAKRASLFIRMNDLLTQNNVIVPITWRANISAISNKLRNTDICGWDSSSGTSRTGTARRDRRPPSASTRAGSVSERTEEGEG